MLLILTFDRIEVMHRDTVVTPDGDQYIQRNLLSPELLLPGDVVQLPQFKIGTSARNPSEFISGEWVRIKESHNKWTGNRYFAPSHPFQFYSTCICELLPLGALADVEALADFEPVAAEYSGNHPCTCYTCGGTFHGFLPDEQDCSPRCRAKREAADPKPILLPQPANS